jgi:hypothetical protein
VVAETIPPIETTPITEPPAAPKRGRRKSGELSQSPAAIRAREYRARQKDGAPQRPSTRGKSSRRTPRKPSSLVPELTGMLTILNAALIVSPLGTRPMEAIDNPNVQPTRIGDELDAVEITALATAIDAQAKRSPRFRKAIERFLQAGAGGQLVGIAGIILARRAARHGLIPPSLDPMFGMMLAGDVSALAAFERSDDDTAEERDPETGEREPGIDPATIPPLSAVGGEIDFEKL